MTEDKVCTPEKLLEGFFKMSPEDQDKVRAKLSIETKPGKTKPCCDPAEMMGMMKAKGIDPMAMCKEMMGKDQPKVDSQPKCSKGKENC